MGWPRSAQSSTKRSSSWSTSRVSTRRRCSRTCPRKSERPAFLRQARCPRTNVTICALRARGGGPDFRTTTAQQLRKACGFGALVRAPGLRILCAHALRGAPSPPKQTDSDQWRTAAGPAARLPRVFAGADLQLLPKPPRDPHPRASPPKGSPKRLLGDFIQWREPYRSRSCRRSLPRVETRLSYKPGASWAPGEDRADEGGDSLLAPTSHPPVASTAPSITRTRKLLTAVVLCVLS